MQLDPDLIPEYKELARKIVDALQEQDSLLDLAEVPGGQERFAITQEVFRRLLPDEYEADMQELLA